MEPEIIQEELNPALFIFSSERVVSFNILLFASSRVKEKHDLHYFSLFRLSLCPLFRFSAEFDFRTYDLKVLSCMQNLLITHLVLIGNPLRERLKFSLRMKRLSKWRLEAKLLMMVYGIWYVLELIKNHSTLMQVCIKSLIITLIVIPNQNKFGFIWCCVKCILHTVNTWSLVWEIIFSQHCGFPITEVVFSY